ncbi:MAG: hypothetical protein ISS70_02715 [Phycisphaerae bacterium]|nr:hypothetical protein [Phycisphaerae bacterium]
MNKAETRAELIDPKLKDAGNGKEIYQICMKTGVEGLIAGFGTANLADFVALRC